MSSTSPSKPQTEPFGFEVIEIHEFSTGIQWIRDAQSWVSLGLTGKYMNITLPAIPEAVTQAITNQWLAVGNGQVHETPTILGREVLGQAYGHEDWAVIALVSPAKDSKGRSFGAYRYFLCQAGEAGSRVSLFKLLMWLEGERQQRGCYPVFNPTEQRSIGCPTVASICTQRLPVPLYPPDDTWFAETPVILPLDLDPAPNLYQIHQLAARKANQLKLQESQEQLISWAANVEELANPQAFLVIQPASEQAIQSLTLGLPELSPVPHLDLKSAKSTVKALAEPSKVDPESLEKFVNSLILAEQQFNDEAEVQRFWHTVFDKLGAKEVVEQGIYTGPMVRMLTLRAIVIPETLPQYLEWLQIKKNKKRSTQFKTALEFQHQLKAIISPPSQLVKKQTRNIIQAKLFAGLKICIFLLFQDRTLMEPVLYTVGLNRSVWSICRRDLCEAIEHDLQFSQRNNRLVSLSLRFRPLGVSYKLNEEIWKSLEIHSSSETGSSQFKDKKFSILAQFFAELRQPLYAACFYQLSQQYVPRKIYLEITSHREFNNGKPFGIELNKGNGFVVRAIVRFLLTIPILMLLILLIPWILEQFSSEQESPESLDSLSESTLEIFSLTLSPSQLSELGVDEQRAISQLRETIKAIQDIERSLIWDQDVVDIIGSFLGHEPNSPELKQAVRDQILNILTDRDLTFFRRRNFAYSEVIRSDDVPIDPTSGRVIEEQRDAWVASFIGEIEESKKEQWTHAIAIYQHNNGLSTVDGIIDRDGETAEKLRLDVQMRIRNLPLEQASSVPPESFEPELSTTPTSTPSVEQTPSLSGQSPEPQPSITPVPISSPSRTASQTTPSNGDEPNSRDFEIPQDPGQIFDLPRSRPLLPSSAPRPQLSPRPSPIQGEPREEEILAEAVVNFNTTNSSLNGLVFNLLQGYSFSPEDEVDKNERVLDLIQNELEVQGDVSIFLFPDNTWLIPESDRLKWAKAIYDYQKSRGLNQCKPNGIMGQDTTDFMQQQIFYEQRLNDQGPVILTC